jgi:omega-6 fatty acid desaturase (delta-12 desaturase)
MTPPPTRRSVGSPAAEIAPGPVPSITKAAQRAARARARDMGPPRIGLTVTLLAIAFGGYFASVVLVWRGPVLLAVPLFALSMTILSVVVHECAHGSLFGRRAADDIVGYAAGLCTLTPFHSFRRGHMAHHRWVGSALGRDPTGRQVDRPKPRFKPNRLLDVVVKARLLPVLFWVGIFLPYFFYDLFPTAGPRRSAHLVQYGLNLLAMALLLAAIAGLIGTTSFLFLVLPGTLLWGMLYEHLFTVTQHFGLKPVPEGKTRYRLVEQVNFSRTIDFPLSCLFFHFTLHKEHHLFPGLNFQYLPAVHAELKRQCPDAYAFTRGDWRAFVDRKRRFHEMLTPRVGDPSPAATRGAGD